jgi:hypothetical protein
VAGVTVWVAAPLWPGMPTGVTGPLAAGAAGAAPASGELACARVNVVQPERSVVGVFMDDSTKRRETIGVPIVA